MIASVRHLTFSLSSNDTGQKNKVISLLCNRTDSSEVCFNRDVFVFEGNYELPGVVLHLACLLHTLTLEPALRQVQ